MNHPCPTATSPASAAGTVVRLVLVADVLLLLVQCGRGPAGLRLPRVQAAAGEGPVRAARRWVGDTLGGEVEQALILDTPWTHPAAVGVVLAATSALETARGFVAEEVALPLTCYPGASEADAHAVSLFRATEPGRATVRDLGARATPLAQAMMTEFYPEHVPAADLPVTACRR